MDDQNNQYKEYKTNGQSWNKEKVMEYLCDKLATSSRGIGNIIKGAIKELGDFPNYSTIMKWLSEDEKLSDTYARAKEAQADYMADEMLDIADDGTNDWMLRQSKGGEEFEVANKEAIQRSRLRVDTRKWLASKLKPKKYGERIHTEVSGELSFANGMQKVRDAIESNPDLEKTLEEEISD